MLVDFSLPTTAGDTRSISSIRPKNAFIFAESRTHLKTNEGLKEAIRQFSVQRPALASKVELVVVALLHKEPVIAKTIAEAFAKTAARQAGLECIWLDWKGESIRRLGVPLSADAPAYALLDRDGCVRWGKFGHVPEKDHETLLGILSSLT